MRSYTRTRRSFAAATALSAALFLGACSDETDTDDPDQSETTDENSTDDGTEEDGSEGEE